jgi:hypothetical protein
MRKRSSKKKRPDLNELAADIIQETVNPQDEKPIEEMESDHSGKNPAAVALGRLGGLKGGPARAKRLTKKQRSEAARKAALARWRKKK